MWVWIALPDSLLVLGVIQVLEPLCLVLAKANKGLALMSGLGGPDSRYVTRLVEPVEDKV